MFELFVGSVVLIALQRAFQNSALQSHDQHDRFGALDPSLDEQLDEIGAHFVPVFGIDQEYGEQHPEEARLLEMMRSVGDGDDDLQLATGPRVHLPPLKIND